MTIGIYRIVNKINNKCYIGQSKNVEQRVHNHFCILRRGAYGNSKLQNAWNKYGEGNFTWYLLKECSMEELDSYEIHYIAKYNSINEGYNNTEGGCGTRGYKHTQDFKDMIALNNKTRPNSEISRQRLIQYNKTRNYHHSEETKQKIKIAHQGVRYSPERCELCSITNYIAWENADERRKAQSERWKGSNNPHYTMSPEQKVKRAELARQSNLGKKRSPQACEHIGNINRGTKYMTNGKRNVRVREPQFEEYLSNGYHFGRTKFWLKREG